jgi:hypothetical protein
MLIRTYDWKQLFLILGDMISSARKISGMDRAMKPQWADLHLELKA